MEILKYRMEWLLLLTAISFAAISVVCDVQSPEITTWFARSGSIVVLFAVIVEFRLSSYIYEDVLKAAQVSAKKKGLKVSDNPLVQANIDARKTVKPEAPRSRKLLSICAHILVITGTVIWGYGDKWVS
ncbi:hypothetical protein [Aliivibrio fischeri]|uniref:Uncharacterized protein n=1 Tax=Aliivibrio fischeri TaxID=668 RepID=A0A844NYU5_ALIFS|nr:hypothetical protein [Aliivibrio fischeri]MUK48265.1 hypothetical protein [Aliivibrio fischeri]